MFKYFLVSIIFVPALIGILAARGREENADRKVLRIGWTIYIVLWFCTVYILIYRWT